MHHLAGCSHAFRLTSDTASTTHIATANIFSRRSLEKGVVITSRRPDDYEAVYWSITPSACAAHWRQLHIPLKTNAAQESILRSSHFTQIYEYGLNALHLIQLDSQNERRRNAHLCAVHHGQVPTKRQLVQCLPSRHCSRASRRASLATFGTGPQ